jgi:hypothetical protein
MDKEVEIELQIFSFNIFYSQSFTRGHKIIELDFSNLWLCV